MHALRSIVDLRSLVDELYALASRFRASLIDAAHGFGDNGASVNCSPGGTVIAQVTVTPQVTGKFRVVGTATFTTTGAPSGATLAVGHNGVQDYTQGSGVTILNNGDNDHDSITVEYGSASLPTTFPVGTPVTLQLFGRAGGGGAQVPTAKSAQIVVQELSA